MAGQQRNPKSSRQARATPEAGHTGETLPEVKGAAKPAMPARKYSAPVPAKYL
jgi:hypothetical protein